MSTATLQITWTVSTMDRHGWILADLFDGSDATHRDTAVARGVAAMHEDLSPIAYVQVTGSDRSTVRHYARPSAPLPVGVPVERRVTCSNGYRWELWGIHFRPDHLADGTGALVDGFDGTRWGTSYQFIREARDPGTFGLAWKDSKGRTFVVQYGSIADTAAARREHDSGTVVRYIEQHDEWIGAGEDPTDPYGWNVSYVLRPCDL